MLFDEIEVLLDDTFDNATQVFRNLRSAIQTHPDIRFIFAGAEDWHKRIKDRTSPLVGNVKPFYLTAATPADIEYYLLGVPLRQCFPGKGPAVIASMIQHALDWTGAKPYYVQALGSRIAMHSDFGEQWADEITRRVEEDIAGQLADFYDKIDPAAQRILGLLAHQPDLTVAGMARRLGVSQQRVSSRVEDLVALDKVRMEGVSTGSLGH